MAFCDAVCFTVVLHLLRTLHRPKMIQKYRKKDDEDLFITALKCNSLFLTEKCKY